MRRVLPFLLAAVLGPAAALLASCGDRSGLIPSDNADRLKSDLDRVQSALIDGKCDIATRAAQQVGRDVDAIPATVDQRLQSRLRDGAAGLQSQVPDQCEEGKTQTETQTTETQPTESVPTEPVPPPTEPTTPGEPPPPTQTVPPPPFEGGGGEEQGNVSPPPALTGESETPQAGGATAPEGSTK